MYLVEIAVRDILGWPGPDADYQFLPRVTFTDPEVGSVGLTEHAARERGLRVRTGIARVPSSARGSIHKAGNDGVIKLMEDIDYGVLAGAPPPDRRAVKFSTAWPLPCRTRFPSSGCATCCSPTPPSTAPWRTPSPTWGTTDACTRTT